jgi:tRNA(Ser,Leu) C12 N-acetylase TAN1
VCNASTTTLDATCRNLSNVIEKHADNLVQNTHYTLPHAFVATLTRHGWKQLILRNVNVYTGCSVQCYRLHYIIKIVDFGL